MSLAQNAALVVIDMQPKFATRFGYHKDPANAARLDQVLQRQSELIKLAKESGMPILTIEYTNHGATTDLLKNEIGNYPDARTFVKSTDGMFEANSGVVKEINEFLKGRSVSELLITGANGGACVRCSIEGALNSGYQVWTDDSAIIDLNYNKFVYPYRYQDGSLRLDSKELQAKLNQRTNVNSLREIIAANNSKSINSNLNTVSPENQVAKEVNGSSPALPVQKAMPPLTQEPVAVNVPSQANPVQEIIAPAAQESIAPAAQETIAVKTISGGPSVIDPMALSRSLATKIGIVGGLVGLYRAATESASKDSISREKCPDSNNADTFKLLAQYDQDVIDAVAADCKRRGREPDYSGQLKEIVDEGKGAISRAVCTGDGIVKLIHKNGTTSKIKYSGEHSLASFSVSPSDADGEQTMNYSQNSKKSWRVVTTIKQKNGQVHTREESWQSLQSRSYCATHKCTDDEMTSSFEGYDDSTDNNFPYGYLGTEKSLPMSETLYRIRRLLLAGSIGTPSFDELCTRLGTKAPQEVVFSDPNASGVVQQAQATHFTK